MKQLIGSLKSGNWRSLIACFLYFDTGFTIWVLFGPLAPFIGKSIPMSPMQQGFLVAVPVLAAAILRVTLGNLYQTCDGRRVALLGIALSAVPALVLLLMPFTPSYTLLLVLGVFLGVGGASFAVALPMAGSTYAPKVQGMVLGIAAAGNIGAVLDGFMFPGLAQGFGWQKAAGAALPLLGLAALAVFFWAQDRAAKTGSMARALGGLAINLAGMIVLVVAAHAGLLGLPGLPGHSQSGVLLLPLLGALMAIAVLPRTYRQVLAQPDTWAIMLVYSITFGGFVGMSSYVATLLTTLYHMPKIEAGLCMALFAFSGAIVRPLGGILADRVSGVRALIVILAAISVCDFIFAAWMPPLAGGIALLFVSYIFFGLGNGATFQLVPHRWPGKTGLMSGIIGAAGGIGGFYLPVIMGMAQESTGSYRAGFAIFSALAASAFVLVVARRQSWLDWALPAAGEPPLEAAATAVAQSRRANA